VGIISWKFGELLEVAGADMLMLQEVILSVGGIYQKIKYYI
jgi:hypothetical protein